MSNPGADVPRPPRDVYDRRINELGLATDEAVQKVAPGSYVVLFEVSTEWDRSGHRESRNLIISKPVTVGVFFESELQSCGSALLSAVARMPFCSRCSCWSRSVYWA